MNVQPAKRTRLVFLIAAFGAFAVTVRAASQPNIIVILADDLGYGDLGCYGSTTIATPRIDRMAREGVRFTDAYAAAPFCSPARAALLTGRLPARSGVPYVLFPAEHHGLPDAEITVPELLREKGYATACIGKWHLGWDAPFRPQRQGFDVFFGLPYSNDSNEWPVGAPFMQVMGLLPLPLIDGGETLEAPVDQSNLTRRYTDRAVAFIREHHDRPFFLYLAHTMPHVPQYAGMRFEGKSRGGLYGDTVEEIDWSTGVILDTLREQRIAERTLVVFTSDNGAPSRRNPNVAAPKTKTGKSGANKGASPTGERFPGRAHAGSNAPLRGGKGTTFEGGVRIPMIAWWPDTIAPAHQVNTPVSHLDFFPTFAALAGAAVPSDRVYDGQDIGPKFEPAKRVAPLTYYFGYQLQAVRDGPWKLFVAVDKRPEPRPASLWWDHQPRIFETQHRLLAEPELYDLSGDVGETQNVAAQHPELVTRLTMFARTFDTALQRDARPIQFVEGPAAPPPQTIRTPQTDVSAWRKAHGP